MRPIKEIQINEVKTSEIRDLFLNKFSELIKHTKILI